MNSHEKYYRENLYPFQDGVLNIVKRLNIPFYLTGGTALSRVYFNHRYSDDLDLFMNNQADYSKYVQMLFSEFEARHAVGDFLIDYQRINKYEHFTQIFLIKENKSGDVELKIDLINDVASHFNGFIHDPLLGTVDGWRNILSNKLSAIFRYEAKDIVDIRTIAKNKNFDWMSIIQEAKTKEAAVDPVVIYNILKSFPEDALSTIKWVYRIDTALFRLELDKIAEDIFNGRKNSLNFSPDL
jgi:hypothetical protein